MVFACVGPLRAQDAAGTASATPQDAALRVEEIRIGFDGHYKVGLWTPLWVTLTAQSPMSVTLSVEAPDPDDDLAIQPGEPWSLKAGISQKCETIFKTGRVGGELNLRFRDATGRLLLSRKLRPSNTGESPLRPAIEQDQFGGVEPRLLRVTLGSPAGMMPATPADDRQSRLTVADSKANKSVATVVPLASPDQLPSDVFGYQAIDTLVIAAGRAEGSRPAILNQLTAAQDAALRDWVRMGGHLLLSVGADVDAYLKSPVAQWLPVTVTGQRTFRQLHSLESYSGYNVPLVFPGSISGARIEKFAGVMLVQEIEGPVAVRAPFGLGRVTFLALDLDRPPLSDWSALHAVCERLAETGRAEVRRQSRQQSHIAHLGISDLASQLHATLEDFPGVRRLSYWSILGMLLVYVLVIGPLDYLLVTRLLKRPELTWITFPLIVLAAASLAVWGGNASNGNTLQVNQFEVLDLDVAQHVLRARSWMTMCSPAAQRYAISIEPLKEFAPTRPPRISPAGIPENKVGGLYRAGGLNISGKSYRYQPSARSIENVPIQKWSTKSLTLEWQGTVGDVAESQLEFLEGGRLVGSVQHRLPFDLEDCLLVFAGRAYFPSGGLGRLAPYQSWEPTGATGMQRELKALLTGAVGERRRKEDSRFENDTEIIFKTAPYNPRNHNPDNLIRMLSFYRDAGGTDYTGLEHAMLRHLECAPLLQLKRAILLGRVAAPATQVRIDGELRQPSARATYVRIVLPVRSLQEEDINYLPDLGEELKKRK